MSRLFSISPFSPDLRWRTRWDLFTAPARRIYRAALMRPQPCAWCLADEGERLRAGDSHGICRAHLELQRAEIRIVCLKRELREMTALRDDLRERIYEDVPRLSGRG